METIYFDASLLTSTDCPRKMFYKQIEHLSTFSDSVASIYGNSGHRFLRKLYELCPIEEGVEHAVEYYREKTQGMLIPHREHRTENHLILTCGEYVSQAFEKRFHTFPVKIPNSAGEEVISTELDFALPYEATKDLMVMLCGTIDKVFKDTDGKLAILDYKFISTWDIANYLDKAKHLASLRFYSMMLKKFLGLEYYPAVYLEGIFLKRLPKKNPKPKDVAEFHLSSRINFTAEEMQVFRAMLDDTMQKWIGYLNTTNPQDRNTWPMDWFKCSGYWGDCEFSDLCKAEHSGTNLYDILKSRFDILKYEPLKFQN